MIKYLITFRNGPVNEWQTYIRAKNIRNAEKTAKKIAKEHGMQVIWIYAIKPITYEI
jgi:hypothetical protein